MKHKLPLLLVAVGMTSFALADKENTDAKTASPYTKDNNAWITLTGKVTASDPDGFVLDYGKGAVLVEMDDWDWYKEGYALLKNDQVTVSGRIDRDKGEKTSIEASSVFVKSLSTFFYASSEDEEDFGRLVILSGEPGSVVMQGTVSKINDREFTLTNARGSMVIDTKSLPYNPMDNKGYQQIRIGDVVRVYGEYDEGFFEQDEIHPSSIVTLRRY